jgi:hypothetical protein
MRGSLLSIVCIESLYIVMGIIAENQILLKLGIDSSAYGLSSLSTVLGNQSLEVVDLVWLGLSHD